jgi:hypothetical protein
MLAVCLETDIRIDVQSAIAAREPRCSESRQKKKEKGRAFLGPGPFLSQDPRIRADSAQRCFKKATEKSTSGEFLGGKLRGGRNGDPKRGARGGLVHTPTVAGRSAIMRRFGDSASTG